MVTKKLTPQKGKKTAQRRSSRPVRKARGRRRVSPWLVAGLIVFLAGVILYPYYRYRSGRFASEGAQVPRKATQFCLDVSHWNEGIQWDSLKVVVDRNGCTSKDILHAKNVYPISRVIVKATDGDRFTDWRFKEYWKEAGKREYVRGAYHFFRSTKNPVKQANHYISKVRLRHSDLPPILDVEIMHEGCTKEELNEKVLTWLTQVEKHYGRKPMIYTSDSFARDILSPEITSTYPMWIARYNQQPPRFHDWEMWQFTEKAIVYGVNRGYVDLSVIK